MLAPCNHRFCRECIEEYWENQYAGENMGQCPSCQHKFSVKKLRVAEPNAAGQQRAKSESFSRSKKQIRLGLEQEESATEDASEAYAFPNFSEEDSDGIGTSRGHRPVRRLDSSEAGHTFMQSSKVSALLEEVRLMRQRDATSKCLVHLLLS